ncbi:MBL fold metallo-hydrolase [Pontibaca methylaminivorans]|uniref:Phosphoribosyl 1,2-cyclic phosphate phosphodiesterase n=1 Tax=Pontibaca methylaminivorans TaxID=515897 RepID=A0A1R3X1S5_9RHOB|nr:MBL fold metallo-hydrolase [Pontibaca methylaminivorans]SIT84618.1 phosphoribosyl 1,2-cyclic phosphate phosphodiesterase [Pontibaca methylaminivorans]
MSGMLRATILGCGSSGGVPRLGGEWGACDPDDPRNRRRRCSLLLERDGKDGTTSVLIDTSPDMRSQLLDTGTGRLDGVVYTHSHADHVHGIDDLRMIVFNMGERLRVWADDYTGDELLARFGYAFVRPEGSTYPPILDLHIIEGPFEITGPGGPIPLRPFLVNHGSINALGFRIGGLAYLPDVAEIPEAAWRELSELDCWILDALRRTPHPTHAHLARSLDWIRRARPRRAVLTNLHIDMDYSEVDRDTPDHVLPAHDGMVIEVPL